MAVAAEPDIFECLLLSGKHLEPVHGDEHSRSPDLIGDICTIPVERPSREQVKLGANGNNRCAPSASTTLTPMVVNLSRMAIDWRAPTLAFRAKAINVRPSNDYKPRVRGWAGRLAVGAEAHQSALQSLLRNSYAVFCLAK